METITENIGVYICTGCSIGSSIDTGRLESIAASGKDVVVCRNNPFLCHPETIESLIYRDIEQYDLRGIVIAACSPRVNNDHFRFTENIAVERVNLREQVAWCHVPGDEDTQMLAEDCLKMGLAKIRNSAVPKPYIEENISSEILVIGAGIAGITAAISGAMAGYHITLVEKEDKPGGWIKNWDTLFPEKEPYEILNAREFLQEKTGLMDSLEKITVHYSSEVKSISGQPGKFDVVISAGNREHKLTAGSVVFATGWKPYDPKKLDRYGYGKFNRVITQTELEDWFSSGKIREISGKKGKKNVMFIQCAGSRDPEHLPYCSNVCCGTTLKQAKVLRQLMPGLNVFILYKDIRTPGNLEHFYHEVQKDDQIFMTKGDFREINQVNGRLQVIAGNTLLGDDISINADLVVLATGLTPNDGNDLSLEYRQGKSLPALKYGFPDSHFICFPYETRRTGIYAAGCQRAPQTISQCIEDAMGATLKAIQCIESVKRGVAVHPRPGDASYPELYMPRCTDCKRCTEECPFGSYDETEKGTPLPHPNRCRRCGICLGSCPERIINFSDFSIQSVSSMIKSIDIPDEFEQKPRILVFVCENDAYPAFDMAGIKKLSYSPFIRIIPVRCIGSVNKVWLSDALSHGYDGIMLIGCKPGDDYQCHFITGSELLKTRGENIRETLQTMMLEPERIRTEFLEINEYDKIPGLIGDYLQTIDLIGPNPFKGM